jgi:HisJ family histidinol phosphate phosphatase
MPYTHHSHSGQFCGHAKDTLEEMVQTAIAKGFHTYAMTEHIPRPIEDFYPEEVHAAWNLAADSVISNCSNRLKTTLPNLSRSYSTTT